MTSALKNVVTIDSSATLTGYDTKEDCNPKTKEAKSNLVEFANNKEKYIIFYEEICSRAH